jgi:hypothetical protein
MADPAFPNLLQNAKVTELTANIGAEINSVWLSKLSKEGKDDLALRDQDLADLSSKRLSILAPNLDGPTSTQPPVLLKATQKSTSSTVVLTIPL